MCVSERKTKDRADGMSEKSAHPPLRDSNLYLWDTRPSSFRTHHCVCVCVCVWPPSTHSTAIIIIFYAWNPEKNIKRHFSTAHLKHARQQGHFMGEPWWGPCALCHSIRENATQLVIVWIELGDKPKWLPLNFGFNDVMMCTAPIQMDEKEVAKVNEIVHG